MKDPKEEVEGLIKECLETLYGDNTTYSEEESIKAKEMTLICINKQLEIIRYIGGDNSRKIYDYLVRQKIELKMTWN